MKDAVGGSLLFYIILAFLAVFIIFIAVIMNYAAAYRTNNYVVNMIEQYEGKYRFGTKSDSLDSDTIIAYLRRNNYNRPVRLECNDVGKDGVIRGSVFSVTTYVHFEVPLLGVSLNLPIKNDTKTIYGIRCETSEKDNYWDGKV